LPERDGAEGLFTNTQEQRPAKANLSAATRAYLASFGIKDPDASADVAGLVWMHALAIGYSPAYLSENADGIRRDWPRIPLPDSRKALEASAGLGRQVAALLDTEAEVPGVTAGAVDAFLRTVAVLTKVSDTGILPVRDADILSADEMGKMPVPRDADIHRRQGAYLPHWTKAGAIYSVTFRLNDSLPRQVLDSWRQEREDIVKRAASQHRPLTPHEERELERLHSDRVEAFLDAGNGACHLRDPRIAALVRDALRHFDVDRYDLIAWVVMPNHVHAVLRPLTGHELPAILHSWKSYTATQANRILGLSGTFWMPEYYDHLIRDEQDFAHAVEYIVSNPQRAGLENWPWWGIKGVAEALAGKERHGQDARVTNGRAPWHGHPAHGIHEQDAQVIHGQDAQVIHGQDAQVIHGQDARGTETAQLDPEAGDLALSVGWGHAGKDGVTMPAKGRTVERPFEKPELDALGQAAKACGLSAKAALALLGGGTRDVYLNDGAYWKNIPAGVWEYYIGGYQVIKKWLSYREQELLGRALTADEAREVMNMARRLAAIVLMQPALDENYRRVKSKPYAWPAAGA
jgi:REP element-mobilizing transposase RayT